MIIPDVNVLVCAFKEEAAGHIDFRRWLSEATTGERPVGLVGVVLAGFLRISTHPKIFLQPAEPDQALDFVAALRRRPSVVSVHPGPRHLDIFGDLCRSTQARGNLISDAYLAAIAVEQRAEIATADRDFARFSGLRYHHPLQ